jgi:DNA end-binding protein Ku
MPASRPAWKGQLRLSLVTISVELFTAIKPSGKATFHQIHKPTGKRIHYSKVVDGVGEVERKDIRKGYEFSKGDYVLLEDEELDAVKLETKKTLELVQFVDEGEIPPLYFNQPYYVAPADELSEEAYRVVRDALRETKKIGVGQLALRGNEYLVALKPYEKGLLLETLHYEPEVKAEAPFFEGVSAKAANKELLDIATMLIEKKAHKWDAANFKNHYQAALRELIQRKMKAKGRKLTVEDEEEPKGDRSNVIDLMAALKQSLEGKSESGSSRTKSKPAATSKPRAKKPAAKSTRKKAA